MSDVHAPTLEVWLDGIGLIAPGLPGWQAAVDVLAERAAWQASPSELPAPSMLPPAERRRASRVIRLALALGEQAVAHAGADASQLATVFTASGADGHNCHALCEQLAGDDRQISPTRFHNSVHNAAAGYWGIASRSMQPCQVICAHDGSFGAGLLDAAAQVVSERAPVLLVAYDSEYPEPMRAKRPLPDAAGVAWLLAPARGDASLARLRIGTASGAAPVTRLPVAAAEALRQQFPSLRGLPVLSSLARGEAAQLRLGYLRELGIDVQVQPCKAS